MGGQASKRATSFSYRVALPVLLAVCVTAALAGGFVLWATARSDERALQRETHLVAQVIAQEKRTLAAEQDYYSRWDEAVEALAGADIDWFDDNLAAELYDAAAFDRIYVLDTASKPLYAMYGGGRTAPVRFETDRAAVEPLVERLKEINAAGALAAYAAGNADTVPNVAETSVVDGRIAYVGVTPIVAETDDDDLVQEAGGESFLVAIRFLDGALSTQLVEHYSIGDPEFSEVLPAGGARAGLPLRSVAGDVVGWLTWNPDRPGAMILSETMPAMLAALAIVGFVLTYLLRSLLRTTSALEQGRAEAEHRASHDPLTGLANRARFNQQLEEALSETGKGGTSVALLALDLDRFKQVNDTLGHEAGDQLLQEVARRITPLVGARDTVARLGGDEFAIIQRDVRALGEVSSLSSRIIEAVGTPFVVTGRVAEIGVSIGVVVSPAAQEANELASKADMALYAAKAAGRNTYRVFDDAMRAPASQRDALVKEMREANLPLGKLPDGQRAA